MQNINCDDCTKKNCKQRIKGALCSISKETRSLIALYETRDPVLIARKYINVLESELDRYEKAKHTERVGEKVKKQIIDKSGNIIEFEEEKELDSKVTELANSILKGGKIVNDIINPPKVIPYYQQNNQFNIGISATNEIMSLPEEERKSVVKFIDDKLDNAKRTD